MQAPFEAHENSRAAPPSEAAPLLDAELIVAIFRTLVLIMALLVPRAFALTGTYQAPRLWLGIVAGLYNLAATLACLRPATSASWWNRVRRPLIVALDAAFITLWIGVTGQWDLLPFYAIVVVVAAMWFGVSGGLLSAIFCDFFYLLLWALAASDFERIAPLAFTTQMAVTCVLLPLLGALVGSMSEAQQRAHERHREDEMLLADYRREIDLAGHLQPALLNPEAPRLHPHLDAGAAWQMARTLGGGDYCDLLSLPNERILLCIGDVSGKSARAQSRLPLLKYALRALLPLESRPALLTARLNELLRPDLEPELYIACCCVLLDFKTQRLEWCNAGHIAPLLLSSDGALSRLETSGPPLGLFEDAAYQAHSCAWQPHDALLLYTDGLSDALSFGGSEDGEIQVEKLAARLKQPVLAREHAQQMVSFSQAALNSSAPAPRRWTLASRRLATAPVPRVHRDDVTVLVARFEGESK